MKILTKIALVIAVIFFSAGYGYQAMSFAEFKNIEVYDIENGVAKIKWFTPNWQTKGIVYFGESSDNLNRYTGYSLYNYYHEAILTGLRKNKKYYFKIVAIDRLNNEKESFIQSFSTKGMKKDDFTKPEFKEQRILQTINNAVALSWTTDEKTNAVVYYGIVGKDLNKTARVKSFKKEHELLIYNLKSGTRYNLKIVAKNKAGNKVSGKYLADLSKKEECNPNPNEDLLRIRVRV